MNRLELLDQLQAIDTRIEENARARRDLEDRMANDTALQAANRALEDASASVNQLRARLRSLELEVRSIDDRIQAAEGRLYGGRLTNPKELSGLEQDVKMLKRSKNEIEDKMLDVMAQLEDGEARVASRREAARSLSSDKASANTRDLARIGELTRIAVQLRAARDEATAQIGPSDLQVYENLRQAKRGRAVGQVKGNACGACGFGVPSGLASRVHMGELQFCSNCGRILVPGT